MNQSQSQSQGQSQGQAPSRKQEETADTTGRQSPGGGSAAQSSDAENAEWSAGNSAQSSADSSHTPAGYGDRGQGGEPEDALPPQAEQPGRSQTVPDSELARQAGNAERDSGAFVDE